jgi:hypothetical protein
MVQFSWILYLFACSVPFLFKNCHLHMAWHVWDSGLINISCQCLILKTENWGRDLWCLFYKEGNWGIRVRYSVWGLSISHVTQFGFKPTTVTFLVNLLLLHVLPWKWKDGSISPCFFMISEFSQRKKSFSISVILWQYKLHNKSFSNFYSTYNCGQRALWSL